MEDPADLVGEEKAEQHQPSTHALEAGSWYLPSWRQSRASTTLELLGVRAQVLRNDVAKGTDGHHDHLQPVQPLECAPPNLR